MKTQKVLSTILIPIVLFSGCAAQRKQAHPQISERHLATEEVAIGEHIHAQITSNFNIYTEPQMVAYLNQVGSDLAEHAERKDLPYRFTLLYDEKIYATSAPGGFIYLTTGMINFLRNESELAAVLAHEIGELQYRDPRLSQSKKALEELTKVGAAVAPAFGPVGALAAIGLIMMNTVAQGPERSPEDRVLTADTEALHYMVSAGYDPQGMIDLLYEFLNADPKILPFFFDYYQSRPISEERVMNVQHEFSELPLQGKTFEANPKQYMEMTKGVREIYKT